MRAGPIDGVLHHLRRAALRGDDQERTDTQLLECFLNRRDESAFEALVRRHGPMVSGVCRRVLGNTHDAEDAFQATFLVLVRKAASIARRELLGNWLYGTAYRAALEAKTARRRRKERQASEMPEPEAADSEEALWRDLRPLLDREVSRLPDKYRVPVVLCDLEGGTRREVARRLGVPEGTLSGRLTTAHRMLARRLARHGVTLSCAALAAALSQGTAPARLPSSLVSSTVKTASGIAAGQAGPVSADVAALAEGVMKTMLLTKLKTVTMVVVLLALAGFGAGQFAHPHPSAESDKDAKPARLPADKAKVVDQVQAELRRCAGRGPQAQP